MHTFLNHNKMCPPLEDTLQETCKIIAAIQTNANQMGEGNANIVYVLGHLHLAPSDNSYEEMRNLIMSKGTTTKTFNINHRRKIRKRRSFSYPSFTPFSLIFSLFAPMYA
jgi:hypothetical protein